MTNRFKHCRSFAPIRRLWALLLLALMPLGARAQQEMSVEAFDEAPTDQTARAVAPVNDPNGARCALVKVATTLDPARFEVEAGLSGVMKTEAHAGELWVYVPKGLQRLTIKYPGFMPLYNYAFPTGPLREATVYILRLRTARQVVVYEPSVSDQLVLFRCAVASARIRVDGGEEHGFTNGEYKDFFSLGSHSWQVSAPDYEVGVGQVVLDNPDQTKVVDITLRSNIRYCQLNIGSSVEADIYVDNTLVAQRVRTLQHQVRTGKHNIEARADGHRRDLRQVECAEGSQRVDLTPTPIYGTLVIGMNSESGLQVLLDGQQVGTTPLRLTRCLAMQHTVTLRKSGYNDVVQQVTVQESQTASIDAPASAFASNTPKNQNNQNIQTFTVKGVSFNMVRVPGGTFTMGCTGEQGSDCDNDEKPAHRVTLSSYAIGETEVTQALWEAVMGSNPSYFKGADQPVETVSWDDCQEFIRKLNALTDGKFRMPTEAEWEYAARGGGKENTKYSGSNNLGEVGWYDGNSGGSTHPVKGKKPNALGLYDMSGNVCEWCSDWYGSYSNGATTNPQGPSTGSFRVLRGGSWGSNARICRTSFRRNITPGRRRDDGGLRLVRSLQ